MGSVDPFVIVEFVVLFIFTAWLLRYYAQPRMKWYYLVSVFVSWYLGFIGTFLLPVDIASTDTFVQGLVGLTANGTIDTNGTFVMPTNPESPGYQITWTFVYWSTFILSWVWLPLLQEYYAAGDFTVRGRMCTSLKFNLIFAVVAAVLGGILILWMALGNSWTMSRLLAFLTAAANTWGLLLTVIMMGYGLVECPRYFWVLSRPKTRLQQLEFQAPDLENTLFDAQCAMEDLVKEAKKYNAVIPRNGSSAKENRLRECINMMIETFPEIEVGAPDAARGDMPSESTLAKLHGKMKAAGARLTRLRIHWDNLIREAAQLEAIIAGADSPPQVLVTDPTIQKTRWNMIVWRYKLRFARWVNMGIAILFGLMSLVVVWCELTIPSPIDLSAVGLLVDNTDTFIGKQFVCLVMLSYMSACMYLALFHIKLLDVLTLTGNRLTGPYALCYNATFLCRLQFVLCFNFLNLMRTAQTYKDDDCQTADPHCTSFETVVGARMAQVPFMGTDFNTWLPLLIVLFAIATLFHLLDRGLRRLGIEISGASFVRGFAEHEERLMEGREMISKGRRRILHEDRRKGAPPLQAPAMNAIAARAAGAPAAAATYVPPSRTVPSSTTWKPPAPAAGAKAGSSFSSFGAKPAAVVTSPTTAAMALGNKPSTTASLASFTLPQPAPSRPAPSRGTAPKSRV